MRTLIHLAGAAALVLSPVGLMAAEGEAGNATAREQWHESIQSGYETLAARAAGLQQAAETYCTAPGGETRSDLEQAWLDAFLAWQQVRFVDFGPVESNNLAWQFQFWPDPKNLIARKAGFLLGGDQPPSPELIARSGVAVQGFPMAEYLLFDEPFNAGKRALPAPESCALLTHLAAHILSNGETLAADWQAFRPHYLETDQYRDTTVRSAMTALEILEERRLAQPMGLRGNGKRTIYVADAWRSGVSLKTVEATVAGLQTHFLPGLALLLAQNGQADLAERVEQQFREVLDNFPELHTPLSTLFADDSGFTILQGLYVDVSQLATLVNDQAAVKLGVVRGFNSSDGD